MRVDSSRRVVIIRESWRADASQNHLDHFPCITQNQHTLPTSIVGCYPQAFPLQLSNSSGSQPQCPDGVQHHRLEPRVVHWLLQVVNLYILEHTSLVIRTKTLHSPRCSYFPLLPNRAHMPAIITPAVHTSYIFIVSMRVWSPYAPQILRRHRCARTSISYESSLPKPVDES